MSKKNTPEAVETVTLESLTKKELKQLRERLEVQKELIELQKAEIGLESAELHHQVTLDKYRFSGRSITSGVLHLDSDVNSTVVDYLVEKIDAFVDAHKDTPKKEKPGLTLFISSPGGSVFAGWRLFDELRAASAAGHHITTKVRGMAASMAGILAQAGDTRIIGSESYLMIHEPSTWTGGRASEIRDEAAFMERLTKQTTRIFADRSGKKEKDIRALFERKDLWLDANECLKHNFMDKVE